MAVASLVAVGGIACGETAKPLTVIAQRRGWIAA
jgi:hypothetical protein